MKLVHSLSEYDPDVAHVYERVLFIGVRAYEHESE
jgi:hypothetical protein